MTGLYVPLDVNYAEDDKIIEVGVMAELLYVRSLAFAKRVGKDGHIRTNQLSTIAVRLPRPRTLVARLVEVHLWTPTPSGWFIVAWLKRNTPVAEVHAAKSAAGAHGNHVRWHRPDPDCELCHVNGAAPSIAEGIAAAIAEHR